MPSFLALNAVEDEIRENEEKHTLEFQFEDALKLFERGLHMQKNRDPGTKSIFLELLRFPLFDLERYQNVPPSTPRLKSLALKNYSILLLDELQHNPSDKNHAIETLRVVVDQLLVALELSNDPAIVGVLCSIAEAVGYPKLARVALEELVSNTTNRPLSAIEASISTNSQTMVGPRDEDLLARLRKLTINLGDESTIPADYRQYTTFHQDLAWIRKFQFGTSLAALNQSLENDNRLSITLTKRDLTVIADTLQEGLATVAKKRKRDPNDIYCYSAQPINSVQFQAPCGRAIQPDDEETQTKEDLQGVAMEEVEPAETADDSSALVPVAASSPVENLVNVPVVPVATQAQVLRQSSRNKTSEFGISTDFGATDRVFANHVSAFLHLLGLEYRDVMPSYEGTGSAQHLIDFRKVLEQWDDEQAQVFTGLGPREVDASQPVMQLLDFAAIRTAPILVHDSDTSAIVNHMLDKVQENNHIQQVRFQLLCSVVCSFDGQAPILLSTPQSDKFKQSLNSLITSLNPMLLEYCRGQSGQQQLEIAQALFEHYLDQYMSAQQEIRKLQAENQNTKKKLPAELVNRSNILLELVDCWRGVACDLQLADRILALRYQWTSIFYSQVQSDDPDEIMSQFKQFQTFITSSNGIEIKFSNYINIPTASYQDAETQISKFRAASIFTQVFVPKSDQDEIHQTTKLLESMLMPETYGAEYLPEATAISQFLSTSSLDFKLKLWYVLLENYEKVGESQKSLEGLLRILKGAIDEVTSEGDIPFSQRTYTILQCLTVSFDVSQRLISLVEANVLAQLSSEQITEALQSIIRLCEVLHIFTLVDHAINSNMIKAPQHQSWEKITVRLREMTTMWWCLFYYFYRAAIPAEKCTPDVLNDLLSIIHEHLGNVGYCGLMDGIMLKLNIHEILRLDWPDSEADLLQCLNCRYGISLANEKFTPYNHHAIAVELAHEDALMLTKFIMRMILNKKNLAQVIQRQNVRLVLDTFNTAIGPPTLITRNQAILEEFFAKTRLDMNKIKQIVRGHFHPSLDQSHNEIFDLIGNGGFYYVMALVHLNQYRIKKRTNPEKTDDLDEAIKFFKYDLAYGTNRFETWMGLSQCWDHLAEISLTFTPPDAQAAGGNIALEHQRRAILSALMANNVQNTSTSTAISTDFYNQLKESLPGHLGKLLFYSAVEPLNMNVYNNGIAKRFVYVDNKYDERPLDDVNQVDILKLALFYLESATQTGDDWSSLMLKSEVMNRLNKLQNTQSEQRNQLILDFAIKAYTCAANTPVREAKGGQDVTFEPIQWIILLCWEFFEAKSLPNASIVNSLEATGLLPEKPSELSASTVANCILTTLQGLVNADKKHWLHQPRVVMAKIYEKYRDDVVAAKTQMENIISTKSVSRPLVGIWKPERERPGQHFDFCRDYVIYYADLLFKSREDAGLVQLARKARRFTALSNHVDVWNHVLDVAVNLARDLIGFPKRFTEKLTPTLDPEVFEAKSMELEKSVAALTKDLEKDAVIKGASAWLLALDFCHDLKKLNIGLGHTALVDDLVISIYLGLYDSFEFVPKPSEPRNDDSSQPPVKTGEQVPAEPGKPSDAKPDTNDATTNPFDKAVVEKKKLRVSRRDILVKAAQILKPVGSRLWAKNDTKIVPTALYGKGKKFGQYEEKSIPSVSTEAVRVPQALPAATAATASPAVVTDTTPSQLATPQSQMATPQSQMTTPQVTGQAAHGAYPQMFVQPDNEQNPSSYTYYQLVPIYPVPVMPGTHFPLGQDQSNDYALQPSGDQQAQTQQIQPQVQQQVQEQTQPAQESQGSPQIPKEEQK